MKIWGVVVSVVLNVVLSVVLTLGFAVSAQAGIQPITDVYDCRNLTSGETLTLIIDIDVDDSREATLESTSGRQVLEAGSYQLVRLNSGNLWRLDRNASPDDVICRYNADQSTNE